eukprot:COSAG01_NODE_230_length_21075_cov_13.811603_27_plen_56_part_00
MCDKRLLAYLSQILYTVPSYYYFVCALEHESNPDWLRLRPARPASAPLAPRRSGP